MKKLQLSLMTLSVMAVVAAPFPAQSAGADWLLGVKPVYEDASPGLGVGRFGLGLAADSQTWPAGRDRWSGGFPYADAGPVGVSLAPGLSYRARSNLALEAGVDMTYRSLREPGLVAPDAAIAGLGGVGLNLGLRYDYDKRTQFGIAYRSELRSDPFAARYYVPGAGSSAAPQALSANVQRQLGTHWALLGSLGWQQADALTTRGDAWIAGVGARYRLHDALGVGMALEYSTGNSVAPSRRNFVGDLPSSDGGNYFFGLDLNWRF